ncbi:DUF4224 domain-containing protein [Paraburkholderia atlantica]|uniref:DUF4224 domain-containing protein n=1 Tax=Paraburkholderia atlantica TaxID=2654982 RepID=UPI003D19ECBD
MTPSDLEQVTGLKRYSKQVEWFKRTFHVDVPRRANGSIVMTWATYEALNAKKAGVDPQDKPRPDVELCFD